MTIIHIDKYEVVTNLVKGEPVYSIFAIKGKTKYPIGSEYADMCTEDYLAIEEQDLKYPELFGQEGKHYIPLRTNMEAKHD